MTIPFPEEEIELSIPERFARVASALGPGFPLYRGIGGDLTYGEADQRSAALARRLENRLGRSLSSAVGLLLPHSGWVYPGLLGILRSGHFIVPLDSNQGAEYLRQVWDDCGATILVTVRSMHILALSVAAGAEIIVLDELEPSRTPWETAAVDSSSLAIILYTSGSTGKPKGAMRSHSGLVLTAYRMGLAGLKAGDRISFLTPYSLAASSRAVFGGLLLGATMCGAILRDLTAEQLCHWVRDNGINGVSFPPGVFRAIAALNDVIPMPEVRVVSVGMEPVSHRDVDAVGRHFLPGTRFTFGYASTECGGITVFEVVNGSPWEGELTPAGRPDWGIRLIILDDQLNPVAEGETGQIAVCGRKLSRGYWNRPDINKERFLADPEDPESVMYLTGDLGRLTDGILEHRGRMDFMVKIRGFRVELQPIEAMLMAHPGIKEAVITAPKDKRGNARLVAYYLAKDPGVLPSELRDYLSARRISHEVPSRFIGLEAFPRLGSGKVDRKALPPPGKSRPELATPFVAPRTDREADLVELWAELLDLDAVGVEDNFFQLGGDSLTALEMAYQVERRWEMDIPQDFYEQPTIATLCRGETSPVAVSNGSRGSEPRQVVPAPLRPLRKLLLKLYRAASSWGLGVGFYLVIARLARGAAFFLTGNPLRLGYYTKTYRELAEVVRPGTGWKPAVRLAVQIRLVQFVWGPFLDALRSEDLNALSTIEQAEILTRLRAKNAAALAVSYHTAIHRLTTRIFDRLNLPSAGIFPPKMNPNDRAASAASNTQVLKAAEAALRRGDIVRIFPDGEKGTRAMHLPFFGTSRVFFPGFAELAVRENAAVVAMGVTMDETGRLTLKIGPLFNDSEEGHDRRVELLEKQYVSYLESRWRESPGNVSVIYAVEFLELHRNPVSSIRR